MPVNQISVTPNQEESSEGKKTKTKKQKTSGRSTSKSSSTSKVSSSATGLDATTVSQTSVTGSTCSSSQLTHLDSDEASDEPSQDQTQAPEMTVTNRTAPGSPNGQTLKKRVKRRHRRPKDHEHSEGPAQPSDLPNQDRPAYPAHQDREEKKKKTKRVAPGSTSSQRTEPHHHRHHQRSSTHPTPPHTETSFSEGEEEEGRRRGRRSCWKGRHNGGPREKMVALIQEESTDRTEVLELQSVSSDEEKKEEEEEEEEKEEEEEESEESHAQMETDKGGLKKRRKGKTEEGSGTQTSGSEHRERRSRNGRSGGTQSQSQGSSSPEEEEEEDDDDEEGGEELVGGRYAERGQEGGDMAEPSSQREQIQPCSDDDAEVCRICHCEGDEESPLITPCRCTGSLRFVHTACLHQWIKSSDTRCCELCMYDFIMVTQLKPLRKWEKLQMSTGEKRKIFCSVVFHLVAVFCVLWSVYVLTMRTLEEINTGVNNGVLEWPFWTKLVVVSTGVIAGMIFMYIQCKVYLQLWRRLKAFNRIITVENCPDKPPSSQPSQSNGTHDTVEVPMGPISSGHTNHHDPHSDSDASLEAAVAPAESPV